MSDYVALFCLGEIEELGCRSFKLPTNQGSVEVFVVIKDAAPYVYVNSCPHTGVELDWMPNQFLDIDNQWIQCSTHHALFRIEDGLCVRGPCAGQALQPLAVRIEGKTVYCKLEGGVSVETC